MSSPPDIPAPRAAPAEGDDTARIDVTALRAGLSALHSPDRAEQDAAIAAVRRAPQRYPPPVLYALAATLHQRGESEAALFWYHAGQLRARYDVERCADPTIVDVLALLRRQYGPAINRYAFVEAELAVLRAAVRQALRWDRRTPHAYDHRWVNLHGVRAFAEPGQSVVLSRPRADWVAIAERVRVEYLDGMRAVLDGLETWSGVSA